MSALPSPCSTRKRTFNDAYFRPDQDNSKSKRRRASKSTTSSSRIPRRISKESTVRFAAVPHQTHVVPRWTEDETASSWYSKRDILTFRCQEVVDGALLRTLIQAAAAIDSLPQETAVYRGLERLLSDQITREISERRKRCVISVLVAQKRGLDEEVIAQVSRNCTEKAAAWALTLGSM